MDQGCLQETDLLAGSSYDQVLGCWHGWLWRGKQLDSAGPARFADGGIGVGPAGKSHPEHGEVSGFVDSCYRPFRVSLLGLDLCWVGEERQM